MDLIRFDALIDLDKQDPATAAGASRKRKEPHDIDTDHWTYPFTGQDQNRRKEAARTIAGRSLSRCSIRHLPELHKAVGSVRRIEAAYPVRRIFRLDLIAKLMTPAVIDAPCNAVLYWNSRINGLRQISAG